MVPEGHTGFVAHLRGGGTVFEVNNRLDPAIGKVRATNWVHVPLHQVTRLEMYWKGLLKGSVETEEPTMSSWHFTHSATFDLASGKTVIVSRNIGVREDGLLRVVRVSEADGSVRYEVCSG